MGFTLLNAVYGTVATQSNSGSTSVIVGTGQGAAFASATTTNPVRCVVVDTATSPETVKFYLDVTGRSTDTLTVANRGAESTTDANILVGYTIAAVATAGVLNGITPTLTSTGQWATSTAYAKGDFARYLGSVYVCKIAHTSGTFATDLAAGDWTATGYGYPGTYCTLQDFGGIADDSTECGTAWDSAMDYLVTQGGGTLRMDPNGHDKFATARTPRARTVAGLELGGQYAQLPLPNITQGSSTPRMTIRILWDTPAAMASVEAVTAERGPYVRSTLTGAAIVSSKVPSVIGMNYLTQANSSQAGFSNVMLVMQNPHVIAASDPTVSGIDTSGALQLRIDGHMVVEGGSTAAVPTHSWAWGFIPPASQNNAHVAIDTVTALGWYVGVGLGNHMACKVLNAYLNKVDMAVFPTQSDHGCFIETCNTELAQYQLGNVSVSGGLSNGSAVFGVHFGLWCPEENLAASSPPWYKSVRTIYDPTGTIEVTGTVRRSISTGPTTGILPGFTGQAASKKNLFDKASSWPKQPNVPLFFDYAQRADTTTDTAVAPSGHTPTALAGGTWGISSKGFYISSSTGTVAPGNLKVWDTGQSDGLLTNVFKISATTGAVIVPFRVTDKDNCWFIYIQQNGTVGVYKRVSGTQTTVTTDTGWTWAGFKITAQVLMDGPSISWKVGGYDFGTLVGQTSNQTNTSHGIGLDSTVDAGDSRIYASTFLV